MENDYLRINFLQLLINNTVSIVAAQYGVNHFIDVKHCFPLVGLAQSRSEKLESAEQTHGRIIDRCNSGIKYFISREKARISNVNKIFHTFLIYKSLYIYKLFQNNPMIFHSTINYKFYNPPFFPSSSRVNPNISNNNNRRQNIYIIIKSIISTITPILSNH